MTSSFLLTFREIDDELHRAQEARLAGNEGRARTAARRAAGMAIEILVRRVPEKNYGNDFLHYLRGMMNDLTIPEEIRQAAEHLQARIDKNFMFPFSEDPIEDAQRIIQYVRQQLEHPEG